MANIAMESASTALAALSTRLDVIANNLANVNTTAFKSSRANFQDLIYVNRAQPGTENALGDQRPIGLQVGLGVKVSGTQLDFTQGSAMITNRPLDVLIDGRGFFQVQVGTDVSQDGIAYTRDGALTVNADGELVMANDTGRRIEPGITIDEDVEPSSISIGSDGRVFGRVGGVQTELGQLEIATFINSSGLKQIGENLYVETEASGPANTGEPETDGRGAIVQGALESSNVEPAKELVDLIRTQRAFEMNSQTIRAADEALQTVAQLRR